MLDKMNWPFSLLMVPATKALSLPAFKTILEKGIGSLSVSDRKVPEMVTRFVCAYAFTANRQEKIRKKLSRWIREKSLAVVNFMDTNV